MSMSRMQAAILVMFATSIGSGAALAAPLALPVKGTVIHCLSTGHATSIMAILKASAGPTFEERYKLGPGGYSDTHLEGSWIHKVEGGECSSEMQASTTAEFPGDWRPTP